jgi:hypothetical protein
MFDSRRYFLKSLAGLSGSFLMRQCAPPIPRPRRRTPVDPPAPAEKQDPEPSLSVPEVRRAQLLEQEKEFRETMTQLFTKVRDLKLQVDAIHTSEIFSVAIFKQAQEIEGLAKRLKRYAKA